MRYVPEQKNAKAVCSIIAALAVCGVALYAVPDVCAKNGVSVPTWLFEFIALAAVIAAVFLLIRYGMTHFTYTVRPRSTLPENGMEPAFAGAEDADVTRIRPEFLDFITVKSQGAREGAMECVLGLDDLIAVIPVKKRGGDGSVPTVKQIRDKYRDGGFTYYDYTVTFLLEDALELVFKDGQGCVGVILELPPEEPMARYFRELGRSLNSGESV